jgi:hypothetical protein
MVTAIERKMIGQFYTLTEESIELKKKIAKLEEDLIKSNRRNLDLQYMYDSLYEENENLKAHKGTEVS